MPSPCRVYPLLVIVALVNLGLWLDSFDRYLSSKYHYSLADDLPAEAFWLSHTRTFQSDSTSPDAESSRNIPPQLSSPPTSLPAPAKASPAVGSRIVVSEQRCQFPPENAELPRILFAGDSMMQGVAPLVISRLRRICPQGHFVDMSRQSTGLTVKRYFDWPTKIREETALQRFNILVIFLGPNDPWDIYENKKHLVFPSEEWQSHYQRRVEDVLTFASEAKMRVIWIGLPAMRDSRLSTGATIQNRIFSDASKRFGTDFISIDTFLGSVDKPFQTFIEDKEKGKIVVRANDGIHFSGDGLRMIATKVVELIAP